MAKVLESMQEEKFVEIKGSESLKQLTETDPRKLTFLYFFATWNEDSIELINILKEYFQGYVIDCNFGLVDSDLEENLSICSKYLIETVPTAIMINSDSLKIKTFDQIDPVTIYEAIETQISIAKQNFEIEQSRALLKLEKIVKDYKVALVADNSDNSEFELFLQNAQVRYHTVDLDKIGESNLSKWIRICSGTSSLPVLFVKGKMVGDLGKCKALGKTTAFKEMIPRDCVEGDLQAEFEAIINEERLILFVSSDFEYEEDVAMRCDTCLKTMQLKGLIFRTFDLKGKKYLYDFAKTLLGESFALPYLFKDGKPFDGGINLLEKMKTQDLQVYFDDRLFREDAFSQIKKLINSHQVFAFIKGTPEEPMCGFTNQLISILNQFQVDYKTYNILEDHLIREKIKEFANWKTFPQLYVRGELVGGLDIVKELVEDGIFEETIKKNN